MNSIWAHDLVKFTPIKLMNAISIERKVKKNERYDLRDVADVRVHNMVATTVVAVGEYLTVPCFLVDCF